ncbi:MAG: cell division protein FtsZ [Solirubrobacteraceae bacterium]
MAELSSNIYFDLPKNRTASIKVIGVGGGGSNAVNFMYEEGILGVDFIICNTDAQALNNSSVPNKIQLGASITEGLGAGANPEVGEQAAIESMEEIKAVLSDNTKMIFITAGLGGGTGTGAAPVIASIAKEMGILVVAIVTIPFNFEGKRRIDQAEEGIKSLRKNVDSLIVINNNKLRELYGDLGYKSGFAKADEVLLSASKGIAEVITHHYRQNIDLKDAKTVLSNSGTAIMGSAEASGQNRAQEVIMNALDCPLLNDNKITGAKNVLLLIISGSNEVTIDEIGIINDYIQVEAGNNTNIIMGIGEDANLNDSISVTVIATGFPIDEQRYTGKEQEKIFHTLVEDQPVFKNLTVNNKESYNHLNEPIKNEKITESNWFNEELENNSEYEINLFTNSEKENPTYVLKAKKEEVIIDTTFNLTNSKEKAIVSQEKKQIFTLPNEDDLIENSYLDKEEKNKENHFILTKNETKLPDVSSIENILNESPFNEPISNALNSSIEERKTRLKKFNYQFSNSLKNVNNLDKPAFERQGIELNEKKENYTSEFSIGEGADKEIKLKPNSFFHNNAD